MQVMPGGECFAQTLEDLQYATDKFGGVRNCSQFASCDVLYPLVLRRVRYMTLYFCTSNFNYFLTCPTNCPLNKF